MGASSYPSLVNNDQSFALFHRLVSFVLDAPKRCSVHGTSAVAGAAAPVLAVLRCANLRAIIYACMLGITLVVVLIVCFLAVQMMAIRKGSLVSTESTGLMTRIWSRVCAVKRKLFVSRSCHEWQTVGNLETSPPVCDVPRSQSIPSILSKKYNSL